MQAERHSLHQGIWKGGQFTDTALVMESNDWQPCLCSGKLFMKELIENKGER